MELTADEFVLLRDAHRLFDALHHIHFEPRDELLVPDHPDDDAILSLREMRAQSCLLNLGDHMVDVLLRSSCVHNDDHSVPPSYLYHGDFITVRILGAVDAFLPNFLWQLLPADAEEA